MDILLFNSFGLDGLKHFIVQEDKKVIAKVLFGTEKMTRSDNKITLCKIEFNLNVCKKLSKTELDSLSDTAPNFFHFIQAFGNKFKLRNFVNIRTVEDRVQDWNSSTCGIFQLYFYDNLFIPDEKSKIQNNNRLNKKTTETLLNELIALDNKNEKKKKMEQYAQDVGVDVTSQLLWEYS